MRALSLFIVCLSLGTAAGQEGSPAKDLANFQGAWRLVKLDSPEGPSPPEEVLAKTRFTFKDNRLTITQDGKPVDEASFKIDATQRPRTIDIVAGQGPNKGKVSLGIYAFEGDTLRICSSAPGQKRPAEFRSDRTSRTAVLVLRRLKR